MYAVLNMGYTPSQWMQLNRKEKAFIIACISTKIEEEKKVNKKAESSMKNIKRRKK